MHPVHPTRKHHPHSRLLLVEAFLFLLFTLFLFFIIGAATDANPGLVLLGLIPSFLFALTLIALIQTDHFHPTYTWFVLAGILVLAGIAYVAMPMTAGFDYGTVLLMNALIMGVALAIMHSSYAHEPVIHEHELHRHAEIHAAHRAAEKAPKHVHHPAEHRPVPTAEPRPEPAKPTLAAEPEDEVTTVVHSIEDKVKALNFVIGRVYSVYKGGTERMRNRVRIDKAWYGEFNAIGAHDTKRRRAEALVLLSKIKDRLELLQKSEREVFGEEHTNLRNLARNAEGSDTVIAVLVKNDKDPVQKYYDGAKGFCEEGIRKLSAGGDANA